MFENSKINSHEFFVMLYSLLVLFMKMIDLGNPSNLMNDLRLNGMMMIVIDIFGSCDSKLQISIIQGILSP